MTLCPGEQFGCQNCGGQSREAGTGVCHVCNGTATDPNDPSGATACGACRSNPGKCRNCGGTGCLA